MNTSKTTLLLMMLSLPFSHITPNEEVGKNPSTKNTQAGNPRPTSSQPEKKNDKERLSTGEQFKRWVTRYGNYLLTGALMLGGGLAFWKFRTHTPSAGGQGKAQPASAKTMVQTEFGNVVKTTGVSFSKDQFFEKIVGKRTFGNLNPTIISKCINLR